MLNEHFYTSDYNQRQSKRTASGKPGKVSTKPAIRSFPAILRVLQGYSRGNQPPDSVTGFRGHLVERYREDLEGVVFPPDIDDKDVVNLQCRCLVLFVELLRQEFPFAPIRIGLDSTERYLAQQLKKICKNIDNITVECFTEQALRAEPSFFKSCSSTTMADDATWSAPAPIHPTRPTAPFALSFDANVLMRCRALPVLEENFFNLAVSNLSTFGADAHLVMSAQVIQELVGDFDPSSAKIRGALTAMTTEQMADSYDPPVPFPGVPIKKVIDDHLIRLQLSRYGVETGRTVVVFTTDASMATKLGMMGKPAVFMELNGFGAKFPATKEELESFIWYVLGDAGITL